MRRSETCNLSTVHRSKLSGPIAASFWQNEEYATGLGKDICLDGVVCVVDSVFGEKVALAAHRKKSTYFICAATR